MDEVRYCVFEDERISRMKVLVKDNEQVRIFNSFVSDYNSRCGSFRYRRGSLETAQRQARERGPELQKEALARLAPKTSAKPVVRPAPVKAQWRAAVKKAADKYQLPEALLYALMEVASGNDPRKLSDDGRMGLMQLLPSTARDSYVADAWNPEQNIEGGARHLRILANKYEGSLIKSLAAYHGGEAAVSLSDEETSSDPETREFIKLVMARYQELKPKDAKAANP